VGYGKLRETEETGGRPGCNSYTLMEGIMTEQVILLRDKRYSADTWLRTCQECGHVMACKSPESYKNGNDSWKDIKCKKCKSEGSLDYGTENGYIEDYE
jgi:primosomal protein N'